MDTTVALSNHARSLYVSRRSGTALHLYNGVRYDTLQVPEGGGKVWQSLPQVLYL